jgi:L-lactate utilization protein LutC
MNIFKKFIDKIIPENVSEDNLHTQESLVDIDDLFALNFTKNAGKFIYCLNNDELNEQFLNILQENDWFEKNASCAESSLVPLLTNNNISHVEFKNALFHLCSCEGLIANEGSILLASNQIKDVKPNDLPINIIVIAKVSDLVSTKSEGLSRIKNRYTTNYPTNITSFKCFKNNTNDEFLNYGSVAKNLYLLLVEDV